MAACVRNPFILSPSKDRAERPLTEPVEVLEAQQ